MAVAAVKELAFALFDEGKRPGDPEVRALNVKRRSTYSYYQDWKKLHPDQVSDGPSEKGNGTTTAKSGTTTAPVIVGKITITPENWGFSQYGAILVLNTYNTKVKLELKLLLTSVKSSLRNVEKLWYNLFKASNQKSREDLSIKP